MKSKILVLVLVIVGIIASYGGYIYYNQVSKFTGKVESVQQAQIGELLTITASEADSYKWEILPKTTNFKIIDNGRTLIFSALREGEYLFVCAMSRGSDVELVLHKIIVGKVINDNDAPIDSFLSLVHSWIPSNSSKDEINRLAYSFDLIATNSTDSNDIANFVKLTALSNRAALGDDIAKWKSFLNNLSQYCKENMKGKTMEDHIQLWLKVSSALRQK